MRNPTRSIRTVAVAAVLGTSALLAGCTPNAGQVPPTSAANTPSSTAAVGATPRPTPTPTSTVQALSATDPTAPYDEAETSRWFARVADEVRISLGLDRAAPGMTVHLDAETSQNHLVTMKSLPAGDYSFHLACRGGGSLTLSVSGGTPGPVVEGPCTDELVSGAFTAAEGGTEFRFTATGDPIDAALHYSAATP
ncbi:hypothetical protein NVV95_16325 [Herbiconiux sp. CPCC 205716]|uniref:Lipoprotein n=1 Tax=Herbiconiux gentiana TaxID=2970912 RepID=A0ABT2GIQ4_9MICO|nr:hypothetical protein [Herbiconiux gentiana]MCS5716113.1 hypothetical protein [Herbiconiux gentiana]